ncbi:MAG: hypothetical protein ABI690_06605 [Chloroflexota bacterium]
MSLFERIFGSSRPKIFAQRKWTTDQLVAQGFHYYKPRKRITMARVLQSFEAPKVIKTSWDTIVAKAGYYIAYAPGDVLRKDLDDYDPRPIEPHIFKQTYRPWKEPDWKPTRVERYLMKMGCKPYYKTAGVWAKRLKHETWVQSIESSKPSLSPVGAWLCVGTAGEPWTVEDRWFRARYIIPGSGTYEKPVYSSGRA